MRIVHVQRLEIIECVHGAGRRDGTLVSLSADGRRSFTVSLPRRRAPESGGPTVAAYLDNTLKTLHAWLDPVSGECFVADAHLAGGLFVGTIAAVLLALVAMALLQVDAALMGRMLAALGIGSLLALARQRLLDGRLERALRARLAQ